MDDHRGRQELLSPLHQIAESRDMDPQCSPMVQCSRTTDDD